MESFKEIFYLNNFKTFSHFSEIKDITIWKEIFFLILKKEFKW